jgi:hypothetical protein
MAIAQSAFNHQYHELVLVLSGGYRLGWIIGGCDLLHACVAIGEASVRMTLPTPMKTLDQSVSIQQNDVWGQKYAKVAPDPTIYFPNVLVTPADPAPYWKIVTTPPRHQPSS